MSYILCLISYVSVCLFVYMLCNYSEVLNGVVSADKIMKSHRKLGGGECVISCHIISLTDLYIHT
jgi:hypothetical protein